MRPARRHNSEHRAVVFLLAIWAMAIAFVPHLNAEPIEGKDVVFGPDGSIVGGKFDGGGKGNFFNDGVVQIGDGNGRGANGTAHNGGSNADSAAGDRSATKPGGGAGGATGAGGGSPHVPSSAGRLRAMWF